MNPDDWLLIGLFSCHFLGDFTNLSTKRMLEAKQSGWPLSQIFAHGLVHGTLMSLLVAIAYPLSPERFNLPFLDLIAFTAVFQATTHFLIDTAKAKITHKYQINSPAKSYFWILFGFDQLLHTLVIIYLSWAVFK